MIFEHLIEPDFTPVHQAPPHDIVDAQMSTLDFMTATLPGEAPRTPDYDSLRATPSEAALAQKAFTSLLNGDTSANKNLVNLKTPTAVRHHVAMLSAYDWDFVEEAKKLRGFVVAKLLDEVNHPDARIRLRALQLVGTLTEVASFTERSEVIHKDHTADELVTRLRSKLTGLLPKVVEIETVEVKATEDNE
jgi:hypothetical protein